MKPRTETPIPAVGRGGTSPESFPSRRVTVCYLALLLVASFLLRAWFASGWPGPSRVWDERYSFENVASVLKTGEIRPVRNFYPSPLYYLPPSLTIMAAKPFVDNPEASLFNPERDRFGPTAYHLSRGIQVAYGTASVLLIYLVGSMIFSRPAALLAATSLAFIPWHIQVSGVFKPDAQVVFFLLVALIAGVRWMRAPTLLAALGVGAAVALAASSKLIAGIVGAAFAVGALVRVHHAGRSGGQTARARRYGQIALAGASSVALFVAINPHLDIVLAGLEDIKWDYGRRAQWAGMTKAQIPARTVEYLLDPEVFGPWLGLLALGGYAALWITGVRAARSRPASVAGPRLMVAAFPLLYVLLHTSQSAWFRANNFTHILPPFALALGWILALPLQFARRRLQLSGPIVAAGGLGLVALLMAPGPLFVYRTYTPTTLDIALKTIGARPAEAHGRVVVAEPVEPPGVPWRIAESYEAIGGALLRVSSADELSDERRRRTDAEILLGTVPNKSSPANVVRRRVISPRFGERRGPELTVLLHPWTRRASHGPLPVRKREDGAVAVALPAGAHRGLVSIILRIGRPPALTPETDTRAVYGKVAVPFYRVDPRDRRFDLISERFECCRPGRRLVWIEGLPPLGIDTLDAYAVVWSPGRAAKPKSNAGPKAPQPSSEGEVVPESAAEDAGLSGPH